MDDATARFYGTIAPFDDFSKITDPDVYRPLPDDWWIGLTDVTGSTEAIAGGRYKQVNMAGAAAISAMMNALQSREFPFVFGGDGTSFAVAPEQKAAAADALARTATWVGNELDLDLRVAMVPVSAARAAGHDVRVGRFASSEHVSYAMFSGHGLEWAEAAMKAGEHALAPAPPEDRPDLTGLSCRWQPMPAQRGIILSLLVAPGEAVDEAAYAAIVGEILAMTGEGGRGGNPLPPEGPRFRWPPAGVGTEARAVARGGSSLGPRLRIWLESVLAIVLDKTGRSLGGFDPAAYRAELTVNTDFRKFDDALRMTVDCEPALAERIEARLAEAAAAGLVRYGLHRQAEALMTCIVPSAVTHDHMHFLDGAGGGYARAAEAMKAMG
jgi:hypothetical protein